jgi:RNA polymerase sigma factor (TIGR02999 family)
MSDVTQLLEAANRGDRQAAAELLPLVYDQLRNLAAAKMHFEEPGQTLDATGLVHEAYLKLAGDRSYADRQHFFRVAAEAMRQILVDRARRQARVRHGAEFRRVPLSAAVSFPEVPPAELLELDAVLDEFAQRDPLKADLVKLRFFAGFSEQEVANALGISRATASRYWTFARAWLIDSIEKKSQDS